MCKDCEKYLFNECYSLNSLFLPIVAPKSGSNVSSTNLKSKLYEQKNKFDQVCILTCIAS